MQTRLTRCTHADQRIVTMHPENLAALLKDPKAAATALLQLRRALPRVNVSALAAKMPSLLNSEVLASLPEVWSQCLRYGRSRVCPLKRGASTSFAQTSSSRHNPVLVTLRQHGAEPSVYRVTAPHRTLRQIAISNHAARGLSDGRGWQAVMTSVSCLRAITAVQWKPPS